MGRRFTQLKSYAVLVLLWGVIALLAWLSHVYHFRLDWTAAGRNTLSQASMELLDTIDSRIDITAFARQNPPLRKRISDLVGRYQHYNNNIQLTFVDLDQELERARKEGISAGGELLVEFSNQKQIVRDLSEQNLTNALSNVVRGGERWLVFLDGHGERDPLGAANYDLGTWGQTMRDKGLRVHTLSLANAPAIPENIAVLVIAGPRVGLLPGEVTLIRDYLERGGNLLWLLEPGLLHGMEPVAKWLGIGFHPGVIVDPTTQLMSIDNAAITLAAGYGSHPITDGFEALTVYPYAAGLFSMPKEHWQSVAIVVTNAGSWAENSAIVDEVRFDPEQDVGGPLHVAIASERVIAEQAGESAFEQRQRVVIVGDGDFLSNTYIGNAGNLELGMRIINWLSWNDRLIRIPPKTAQDLTLELSRTQTAVIGFGFLFILPICLLLVGSGIWWLRRRR